MERLFDVNDVTVKPTKKEHEEDIEYCNIGTKQRPKLVKLAKGIPEEYEQRYLDLFTEYVDIFTWSYDDLKTYDTSIIQYSFEIKS